MKSLLTAMTIGLCILSSTSALSQGNPEYKSSPTGVQQTFDIFESLDLGAPGLEKVRKQYERKNIKKAKAELLAYLRGRELNNRIKPGYTDSGRSSLGNTKVAELALSHTFYVHEGYLPPFNYGKDIDWTFWPVKDNELRWQLHRHKWMVPMGFVYRRTKEEKYAKAWMEQTLDWIAKNPDDGSENAGFAWRPLEVSHRLEDQIYQFLLFINSPSLTPDFICSFLENYLKQVEHIMSNFSPSGNHRLFEAQRVMFAGAFFPEFRRSEYWRQTGIDILNREMDIQVYPDGVHFELCPHYHMGVVQTYVKALTFAKNCGFMDAFPESLGRKLQLMAEEYANLLYPDYGIPLFSDTRSLNRESTVRSFKRISELFPDNGFIKAMATEGRNGSYPDYLSKGFPDGGFFVFRSSWNDDATVMVVKAGPPAFWHNQPDNGTFELWHKGRRLFTDSGCYVYGGDAEIMKWRSWFRQSCVHNTITLDSRNFEVTDSKTLEWQPEGNHQRLVTENRPYAGFIHRRTIEFIENRYFVITDEVSGDASGTVNLNWQLPIEKDLFEMRTEYPTGTVEKREEGWLSAAYKHKLPRTHLSYNTEKASGQTLKYVTVIVP